MPSFTPARICCAEVKTAQILKERLLEGDALQRADQTTLRR